ncbi:hypothetical protein CRUP_023063 [Coryphaenoides rupestris]|nr:hypothetical protein CRUP_023063 [Coryphaenoides rupestris]
MEPLCMDGNSSDLEEEEEEALGGRGGGGVQVKQLAPQTPDQEAFLKQHFVTLADDTPSGSPSRSVQSSSENLSISSRFLCQVTQNPPPRRSVFPFSSETPSQAGGGVGGGSRLLVSEVRPLNQPSEGGVRKKAPGGAESRRSVGGVARGVASYLSSSSGLRKAQSVQSLLPDTALALLPAGRAPPYMSPTTSSMAKMSRSASPGGRPGHTLRTPPRGRGMSLATQPSASVVPTLHLRPSASASFGNHGNRQAKAQAPCRTPGAQRQKLHLRALGEGVRPHCGACTPGPPGAKRRSSTSEPWREGVSTFVSCTTRPPEAQRRAPPQSPGGKVCVPTVEHAPPGPPGPSAELHLRALEEGVVPLWRLHHQVPGAQRRAHLRALEEGVTPLLGAAPPAPLGPSTELHLQRALEGGVVPTVELCTTRPPGPVQELHLKRALKGKEWSPLGELHHLPPPGLQAQKLHLRALEGKE